MNIASEPKRCPKCGGPIPTEAPQGLCPKCLYLQASVPTEAGKGEPSKSAPPAQNDLAAAFPQLEILELIGQGGMGFVFKARQPRLERLVALKILPQALAADPAFAERFSREGRLLARLNHPNIVSIHDFGQAGGYFYLLMEYVDGVNLRQAMRAGRFTPAQALVVVPKICEALQFAHNEGILHRDIKPENILVDVRGRVKIADFGIAKLVGDAQPEAALTGTGATLGTPHYMAPEQLETPATVDHRADIYSLGVVFYEMLTGELPLGRFQPPSHKVEMDVRLDEVVLHALEKEPSRRYQHASQVRTAVETIASGTPPAQVAPVSDRFWKRMAMAMALLCLTLIVLIAGFARSFFATQRAVTNLPPATVPAGGTEKQSATLVIDTVPFDRQRVERDPRAHDMLFWYFKYLIPADHLAQIVFVLWSNGVPTIKPGFSGYFKVGQRPVNVENMDFSYEPNVSEPHGGTNVAQWTVGLGFGYTLGHLLTNQPPCRRLETAPRSVLHSGRQLAIRLAEFIQPAGIASNGWSGVEVRLILQRPLSPPVQTDPNEFDRTNYVAGWGLAGMSEDSIMNLIKTLPCEPMTAEKSP
jgi:tRNA A-37 threonylcarbamoyl transferase component Bud32